MIAVLSPKYLYNFIKHHSNFSLALWKMFCYNSSEHNTTHESTNKNRRKWSFLFWLKKKHLLIALCSPQYYQYIPTDKIVGMKSSLKFPYVW